MNFFGPIDWTIETGGGTGVTKKSCFHVFFARWWWWFHIFFHFQLYIYIYMYILGEDVKIHEVIFSVGDDQKELGRIPSLSG